jgi:GT2 family glycosyltransferase
MNKVINVSIVIFNTDILQISTLIESLKENSLINNIFLIDNSPLINKKFRNHFENYIHTGENLGYGKAHNIAIHQTIKTNIKYHLVLNPDIIIKSKVLNPLISYMEANTDIGLLMPNIEYPNRETQHLCKLLATPFDLIGRRFLPFKKWSLKRNEKYELRFTGYEKIMQVPSLSGCFMMLRTDILKKTGGFDERFFMYCEDLDLCRRIGSFSKTVFYPEVSVIHNYEKGSYKNFNLLKYHIISAVKYFQKWGWLFDHQRKKINKDTLKKLGYVK